MKLADWMTALGLVIGAVGSVVGAGALAWQVFAYWRDRRQRLFLTVKKEFHLGEEGDELIEDAFTEPLEAVDVELLAQFIRLEFEIVNTGPVKVQLSDLTILQSNPDRVLSLGHVGDFPRWLEPNEKVTVRPRGEDMVGVDLTAPLLASVTTSTGRQAHDEVKGFGRAAAESLMAIVINADFVENLMEHQAVRERHPGGRQRVKPPVSAGQMAESASREEHGQAE
ncbi:hypothetical protein [Micromonospora carbonacea]|uniref:Uncharacterized protein n=1 Tax=Micromonospora carbonacea TaxID=47853 RepID=A0A1C5AMA7_9ACTN|nr:hypothetical protein [Micromonospora carbonacea]SCF46327.1 hypothetical protein GA0070563_114167 [Micromonospora carbonacea]